MKILAYSSYYKPYTSGLTVYLQRVVNHLSRNNEVSVLTFKHDASLPDTEMTGQTVVLRMPFLFRISKGFVSPQSWYYFFKYLRRSERVIINMPNAEALVLAVFAKLMKKKTVMIYLCDVDLGGGIVAYIVGAVLSLSIELQLMCADHIVAFPDYILEHRVFRKYKNKLVTTIPPIETVSEDRGFEHILKYDKEKRTWVGYVGRLAREKGIEHLIEALRIINNPTYELVLAGPGNTVGEQSYYDSVSRLLKSSGIRYRRYTSPSDAELCALYKNLDVLVLPSVNSTEAFGMVQAEAMLLGTPVVATDLPGVRVPVKLTGCGALVAPADPSQLARELKAIAKAPFKREEVIKKSRKVFNSKKVYDLYDNLLFGDK